MMTDAEILAALKRVDSDYFRSLALLFEHDTKNRDSIKLIYRDEISTALYGGPASKCGFHHHPHVMGR